METSTNFNPAFLLSLCLGCFPYVSIFLDRVERNTHSFLNVVKVSDGVISKGQCFPRLEIVVAVVVISSVPSSVPSLWRLSAAAVPAGHQRRRLASSMRREAVLAFTLQRLHAWRDDRERERCRLTGQNSFCIDTNTWTHFHKYICMLNICAHRQGMDTITATRVQYNEIQCVL